MPCTARRVFQFSVRLCACILLAAVVVAATPASAQTAGGGATHSIILKSDGTVWTVGGNASGQIGDNSTTTPRKNVYQVGGLSGVVAVAGGANHSLAVTSTGALYVWDANGSGQVGNGVTSGTPSKTPVQSNLTNVVAIAAGEFHSVALKSNGDVYAWGKNTVGQLGTGSTSTAEPTPLLIMSGVAAIAAGFNHTIFVKTDGTVYGAGENGNGQLGDASTTDRPTPVQMTGVTGATAAAAGFKHSIILLSSGTLKATGYNGQGQLGEGDTTPTQSTSAVSVTTLTNIIAIAGGSEWTQDSWALSKLLVLIGGSGTRKYRNRSGSECAYNECGELTYEGTYNYEPNPRTLRHIRLDVLPSLFCSTNTTLTTVTR